MASEVVRGIDFPAALDAGLAPEQFHRRFLVEGDSWMDRSSLWQPSLPDSLAAHYNLHPGQGNVLLVSIARFGDTIDNMGRTESGEFGLWLQTSFNQWKFDGVLLSGGGNDIIDAARDPQPGEGILRSFATGPAPASAQDCINLDALGDLVAQRMDPGFLKLYDAVQDSPCKNIPIFLNDYDFPTPRNAPATQGGKSWLYEAFVKNSIPPAMWQELTDLIFIHLQMTIASWTQGRPTVRLVPTSGTLVPAEPGTTGSSNDWLNEIHPNTSGWVKLARVWHKAIREVLP
ncbi:MAG: SGNH/GDSL hydrolase family protein [Ramlibacter sp.]|nr:SGNH/GDSL hydrolase family protein [Ramlibacter sp.]